MFGFRYQRPRGRVKVGPFFMGWSQRGLTFGHSFSGWARNYTRGTDTINLPGRHTGSLRRRYRKG